MIVMVSMKVRYMLLMKLMITVELEVLLKLMDKIEIRMTTSEFHNIPNNHNWSTMHYNHNLGYDNIFYIFLRRDKLLYNKNSII